MLEPVDGPDPYAAIPDAVEWWCVVQQPVLPLLVLLKGTPAAVVEHCREVVKLTLLEADCEYGRDVEKQVATPLFERYVAGVMGAL